MFFHRSFPPTDQALGHRRYPNAVIGGLAGDFGAISRQGLVQFASSLQCDCIASVIMIRATEQELCGARTFGMQIEIDPTVDFAYKMLLGNPDHPEITIHFLNAVLRLASPIVAVEIVNPIVWNEFEADKLSILDILAIDDAE